MRFAQAGLCLPTNMVSRDFLILFIVVVEIAVRINTRYYTNGH